MQGGVLETPQGISLPPTTALSLTLKIHPTANNLPEGEGDLQLIPSCRSISC